jgi:outer membrane beta-barrel protein
MTKSRIVAWLALALCMQVSATVAAQDMSFDLEETESAGGKAEASKKRGKAEGKAEGKVEAAAGANSEAEGAAAEAGAEGGTGEGSLIGDLAADEPTKATDQAEAGPKPTEVSEEIYAVQQVYALRNNRLELLPSFGFSLNDPFVQHNNVGVGLNYWITNVLAVGANMNWYQGLESESDLNFFVRRSLRLGTRPTEFQFGASLNMTYVPVYGKFAMFERYIFQWDAYLTGGVGIMRTRPVPIVDPQIRSFDYTYKLSILNPALGLRVFLTKWLTVFAEMRVYPYLEKLENLRVQLGTARIENKKAWLDDSSTLVFNVVASVGMTMYFPFSFEYKLPK